MLNNNNAVNEYDINGDDLLNLLITVIQPGHHQYPQNPINPIHIAFGTNSETLRY